MNHYTAGNYCSGKQWSLKIGELWLPPIHIDRSERQIGEKETALNLFPYIKYEH